LRSGIGLTVGGIASHAELFSESPSRVVVCTTADDDLVNRANAAGVPVQLLGYAGGRRIQIEGLVDLDLEAAVQTWHDVIPAALHAS
jgi:phosphoribosylformylglycinamidine (FGAM) synthase-like enzyme